MSMFQAMIARRRRGISGGSLPTSFLLITGIDALLISSTYKLGIS